MPALEVELASFFLGSLGRPRAPRQPGPLPELVGGRLAGPGQVPKDLALGLVAVHAAGTDHEVDCAVVVPLRAGLARPVRIQLPGRFGDRTAGVEADVGDDAAGPE